MILTTCRIARLLVCTLAIGAAGAHAAGDPFTVEDLVRLKRISDPQLSPNGHVLAFVQRETDIEANKGRTSVWLLDLLDASGEPQRATGGNFNDSSPRWASDGRTLYFLSNRSGSSQVWRLNLPALAAQKVSDYPLEVSSFKLAPRADRLVVSMEVFPDCATLQCTRERLDQQAANKASGRLYERIFIRHWDTWSDGTRSHLFSAPLSASGTVGAPVDVSKGFDADIPGKPFGDDADYAFSPDGRWLAFSARLGGQSEPWSTNFDIFETAADGSGGPVNLTAANPAADTQPRYLANGDLVWLAQDRPGLESDRFHIVQKAGHGGPVRALTGGWDHSVVRLGATPDGRSLIVTADETGQRALFLIDVRSGAVRKLVGQGEVDEFAVARDQIVLARADLGGPADFYSVAPSGGATKRLTRVNAALLAQRQMSEYEQFSFKGWNDETVYGYVVKPYGFEPGKRFPIAFVVHGGPQSSMQNLWTYRWNAQTFAGGGYGVVIIDFHGSPGYGQAFTDSISKDWGGKPLVDLQKGLAAALERFPWLDGERACALGASYGGFMMNWIEGNWPERFRCIVNHDGLFDQRMMYYATEELWFPEAEFGGPQYEVPENYERVNPLDFVSKWRTPMLVVHGEKDFRIPYTQAIGAFTALQRRGIESKLLIFPDENHWVLKPANSVLWYRTVLGWLDAHLKD